VRIPSGPHLSELQKRGVGGEPPQNKTRRETRIRKFFLEMKNLPVSERIKNRGERTLPRNGPLW
jgi:hypothetical protein